MDTILRRWDGDAAEEEKIRMTKTKKEKERATRQTAINSGGMGAKTMTTKAAVEAMAIAGRVDTRAGTTTMMALMCDASAEEKECLLNLSRMHATIK